MVFSTDFTLGRYIYRRSYLHGLDPRAKLISLIIMGIGIIFMRDILALLAMCLFLALLIFLSKIPVCAWWRGFRIFVWFFLFLLILSVWSGYNAAPSSVAFMDGLKKGLFSGTLASIKWAFMVGVCLLFTMTTSPVELTWAMEGLLIPLRGIGLPVQDIAIMSGLTLHFLPLIKDEADRIIRVQKLRGIDFNEGGVVGNITHIIDIIPPLIHRLMLRSETIAMAMESRGYSDKGMRRVFEPFRVKDVLAVVMVIVYLIVILQIVAI